MFRRGKTIARVFVLMLAVALLASTTITCLADAYSEYFNAYVSLMANGLVDADMKIKMEMDGETIEYTGNMKVDSARNYMMYEMGNGENKSFAFSDGSMLYTDMGGKKIKFSIVDSEEEAEAEQAEPAEPAEAEGGEPAEEPETPVFTAKDFVNNFSSLLDPGKIAELGLLSPINEVVVTDAERDGNVYRLYIADGLVKLFLNTIAEDIDDDEDEGGEGVEFTDLKNFGYKATVDNGIVTSVNYTGDLGLHVPASITSSGSDADYSLAFDIQMTFNNPGNETQFELPSTEGYEEVDLRTEAVAQN